MNLSTLPGKGRTETTDVVVLGAGVIGAAVAASASKRGYRTTIVDPKTSPGFGSTSTSAGILRVHASDVESSILADESIYAWNTWREYIEAPKKVDAAVFERCGSYILDDGSNEIAHFSQVMKKAQVDFSELDIDELEKTLPWMDVRRFGPPSNPDEASFWQEPTERLRGAVHTPASGYISDPALAAQNLVSYATRYGAKIYLGKYVTEVTDEPSGTLIVDLDDGTRFNTAAVVNATGPHSKLVNTMLRVGGDFRVTQRLLRQELHSVVLPQSSGSTAHVVDGDLGINFRPEGNHGFLVGGSGTAVDGEKLIDHPENLDSRVDRQTWLTHVSRAGRRIPGLCIPPKPVGITGLYDVTEDWLPIYDRTERPGVFVAIGTSGNQFKTAPVIGNLMMDIISASLNGHNTDEEPITITMPFTRRQVDTSCFSRLRSPKTGGSRG